MRNDHTYGGEDADALAAAPLAMCNSTSPKPGSAPPLISVHLRAADPAWKSQSGRGHIS